MQFSSNEYLLFSLIALAITLVILYYIIRLAARDGIKEAFKELKSEVGPLNNSGDHRTNNQNIILSLLLQNGSEEKKFALSERKGGATKIIDASELNNFNLEDYQITVVSKTKGN